MHTQETEAAPDPAAASRGGPPAFGFALGSGRPLAAQGGRTGVEPPRQWRLQPAVAGGAALEVLWGAAGSPTLSESAGEVAGATSPREEAKNLFW